MITSSILYDNIIDSAHLGWLRSGQAEAIRAETIRLIQTGSILFLGFNQFGSWAIQKRLELDQITGRIESKYNFNISKITHRFRVQATKIWRFTTSYLGG